MKVTWFTRKELSDRRYKRDLTSDQEKMAMIVCEGAKGYGCGAKLWPSYGTTDLGHMMCGCGYWERNCKIASNVLKFADLK